MKRRRPSLSDTASIRSDSDDGDILYSPNRRDDQASPNSKVSIKHRPKSAKSSSSHQKPLPAEPRQTPKRPKTKTQLYSEGVKARKEAKEWRQKFEDTTSGDRAIEERLNKQNNELVLALQEVNELKKKLASYQLPGPVPGANDLKDSDTVSFLDSVRVVQNTQENKSCRHIAIPTPMVPNDRLEAENLRITIADLEAAKAKQLNEINRLQKTYETAEFKYDQLLETEKALKTKVEDMKLAEAQRRKLAEQAIQAAVQEAIQKITHKVQKALA